MQLKYIKIRDLFIQIINNERKSECMPIKYISFDLIRLYLCNEMS